MIEKSLQMAAAAGASTVALAAIGTGYGRLSMSQFAAALEKVAKTDYAPLEYVTIGQRKADAAQELARLLGPLKLKLDINFA